MKFVHAMEEHVRMYEVYFHNSYRAQIVHMLSLWHGRFTNYNMVP